MDIKYHIETAWKHCISNIPSLILLTLVVAAVSIVSIGILAPVAFAGYTHSLFLLLKNNREPKVQDVFSQLKLFVPLFLFGLIVLVITAIGITLFVLPGLLFSFIIGYTCLYMIPVMVDKNFGLLDAIKKSISLVTTTHLKDHIIVFIIFAALSTIGGSSILGFLLLQPFATLFVLSVYEEIK
ncbi:MAG: hypothetical protein KKE44_23030 [Proteobacteria bacterium]|nr:hypothetical protein [Pseudomonadota bacterium]MBU1585609.1 hypothetical protein [Pseudomonadota bacterium]MBU2453033.1 hypothetical protein [Pseudomonadota bacterium]